MSSFRHSSLASAYTTLGLAHGSSFNEVKAKYKQIALRTHPDKNPNNPDATVEFQRVSEAYRTISTHINNKEHDDDMWDDDYYDSSDDEIPMELYLWLFSRLMNDRIHSQNRYSYTPYRQDVKPESRAEYQERLSRTVEEQRQAEQRRKRENEIRKEQAEQQREAEHQQAAERQKQKKAAKKAQTKAKTKKAEQTAKTLQERSQNLRSSVFQAARERNPAKVKEGIYEYSVDASGGEVRPGCEKFVKILPKDPQETLLHIATQNGDADLVEYLDRHSAEPDERNSEGLTPVQLALKGGDLTIVTYFFKTYPPKDPDHETIYSPPEGQSLLTYASQSLSPQLVDLVLSTDLANGQDIKQAWDWTTSMADISTKDSGKLEDILALLKRSRSSTLYAAKSPGKQAHSYHGRDREIGRGRGR